MEVKGKVVTVLPQQSGTSQAGNQWKKQEFVIETHDQFPKKICLTLFGDRVDQYPIAQNDEIVASIDIESREYNGRWYTNVNAWKIEKATAEAAPAPQPAPVPSFEPQSEVDELPF
ncbi:MAG: DUF3127 domain-containing protein [Bacteroidales bacterium]|nr:DUF3127 domain-containing protein [Bacteroidales bacterium]